MNKEINKEDLIKRFREKFVADNVLDCIPEKNWQEMEGEVLSFILIEKQKSYKKGQEDILKEIKNGN